MAKLAKFLQGVAGAAGGAGLNVEEVFSTYLYDGTGTTKTISNGIDLSTEGGMTWFKRRNGAGDNQLFDSERTGRYRLESNTALAQADEGAVVWSTRTDGFSIGGDGGAQIYNSSSDTYASWTFRKAPKFFDVVTYSGSVGSQSIAHNLGSTPGLIITKKLDSSGNWAVYHRSLGATKYTLLNNTSEALTGSTFWNDTEPTSTHFTVGTNDATNKSGRTYVAYLFAHNDGDAEFGPDGDADIIKCGSYTGNGLSTGPVIDLGFEPQWILLKGASGASSWILYDTMRGMTVGTTNAGPDALLFPHSSAAEYTDYHLSPTPTGFQIRDSGGNTNSNGNTYIYIAIRRGPMAVPESATDVFAIDTPSNTTPVFVSGFTTDMGFWRYTASSNTQIMSRITGQGRMYTNLTNASSNSSSTSWDYQNGWFNDTSIYGQSAYSWMWRRAPNYFDVVAYTGNGTAGRTVSHNLGVTPEMIWFKKRSSSQNWYVYHKDNTYISGALNSYLRLNTTDANINSSYFMSSISSSNFGLTIGSPNDSGATYIAYLFASLDGVSKVGSYTGNGSSQTIDCGFSSGARFVLIKRTDSTSDWWVFDTERGIVAGNDSLLALNGNAAEGTGYDNIDPDSSGFIINNTAWNENASGGSYIFYAVA